jgi:acyl-CoA thioester hydrolase
MAYTHESKVRVRYSETDQMGYCYYGNYAAYFEVGRVETLRSLGVNYKKLEQEDIMLPVIHYAVDFRMPATYDDLLTIRTHIKELKGVRIYFEYDILNSENILICSAKTTLVFMSKQNRKPMPPPANIKQIIQAALS